MMSAIRSAPIEPGMPVPDVLVVAPPAIRIPSGPISPKFEGAEKKCIGLADAYQKVCEEQACHFFDAGRVTASSTLDGVHLDAAQHLALGHALSAAVMPLLTPAREAIN